MNTSKELYTSKEAASYLGVSEGLLRLSRITGELFKSVQGPKCLKLGTAVRYTKESLVEWVSSQPEFRNTAVAAITDRSGGQ